MDPDPQFRQFSQDPRLARAPQGPLAKVLAFILSAAFLVLAFMFSLVALAVVAEFGRHGICTLGVRLLSGRGEVARGDLVVGVGGRIHGFRLARRTGAAKGIARFADGGYGR